MRKKNNFGLLLLFIILISICIGFVLLSSKFEQNIPTVEFENNGYWNLKDKLKIILKDDTGIIYYKITFKTNKNSQILENKILKISQNNITLNISPPKLDMFFSSKEVSIIIETIDNSKWNFLNGNSIIKEFKLKVDPNLPTANVIHNSLSITRGGSAVVVVEVFDKNLQDAYISFNDKYRFKLSPFYKNNFYVSLITWPINIEKFESFSLIVKDKANNIVKNRIPLYIRNFKVKNSNLKITDKFIQNVSANVLLKSSQSVPYDTKAIFIKANRFLRVKNINHLRDISLNSMSNKTINSFNINSFKRLRGSKRSGEYGTKRYYFYKKEKIDESWHLGIDWFNFKNSQVLSYNKGKVIFNDYLGIYGNSIVINHGMGLFSLFSHLNSSYVKVGDTISANQKIGTTGSTGAALGDHLHFGILIQGIESNPVEWSDKKWIKTRITNILKDAKILIDIKNR